MISDPSSSSSGFSVPSILRRHAQHYRQDCSQLPTRRRTLIPSMFESRTEGSIFTKPTPQNEDQQASSIQSPPPSSTSTDPAATPTGQETPDEKATRERVEYWAASLFQNSPMIRFMTRHLKLVGCDPYDEPDLSNPNNVPRLGISNCSDSLAGGFTPSDSGQKYNNAGILICANHILNKRHLEQTLAHEMIHWWDHCRFRVDWNDLRQHACSEIRAASLSGDCNYSMETTRSPSNITKIVKHHQKCVRRRAVLSIVNSDACKSKDQAEKVVDEVWNSCFGDTRPFDEIYTSST